VEWDGTEEMRKHVLDQYMEELYELEFNDMVAGMPTRFRYVPVANTSFGLSASEILLADDKDLNEYVGLKKLAPFRKLRDTWDARRGERLREFKNKISGRLEETDANGIATEHLVDGEHKAKKRKGKKERMREKAARTQEEGVDVVQEVETKAADSPRQSNKRTEEQREDYVASSEPVKKKRRRQKKAENSVKQAAE
jgi:protein KRI1